MAPADRPARASCDLFTTLAIGHRPWRHQSVLLNRKQAQWLCGGLCCLFAGPKGRGARIPRVTIAANPAADARTPTKCPDQSPLAPHSSWADRGERPRQKEREGQLDIEREGPRQKEREGQGQPQKSVWGEAICAGQNVSKTRAAKDTPVMNL